MSKVAEAVGADWLMAEPCDNGVTDSALSDIEPATKRDAVSEKAHT